jgi:drug/metabolite transporter superfamily protein YnfA
MQRTSCGRVTANYGGIHVLTVASRLLHTNRGALRDS